MTISVEHDEVVSAFLVESLDGLDQLDRDLVTLEQSGCTTNLVSSIFRVLHTIKGTSSLLSFSKIEGVSHAAENLLSGIRDGHVVISEQVTSALLQACDSLRRELTSVDSTGAEDEADYSALVAQLARLGMMASPQAKRAEEEPQMSSSESGSVGSPAHSEAPTPALNSPLGSTSDALSPTPPPGQLDSSSAPNSSSPVVDSSTDSVMEAIRQPDSRNDLLGNLLMQRGLVRKADLAVALGLQRQGDVRPLGEILVAKGFSRAVDVADALQSQADSRGTTVSDSTIRVDVALLDKLMNLVGELVLARNQILQHVGGQDNSSLAATSQRLNLITSELQEGVMKTRMQPIGNVWNQLPRVVRDLAIACGKRVRIEMEGKETELDKTIIEAIKAPLTHIVRNSVDHGFETPAARLAAGKPAEGRLFLRAFHEGGQVNIEISDDGAGVNPDRIRQKGLQRGLITAEQAVRMTERELVNLLFLPGFSTAEKVTNISGRGVGMDVVKTHVEKIGGTVDLQSKVGEGTTLRVKIPLTLAIIPALTITCGNDRFAIPQVNLVELVRLEGEHSRNGTEEIAGASVYRLRGRLLPLVYLTRALRMEQGEGREKNSLHIVVLQAGDRTFGLVVDEVNDTEEIVVKPLGKQLKGISVFAGATIMGDGKVALILDVLGLAKHSSLISEGRDSSLAEAGPTEQRTKANTQSILLFGVGKSGRLAVPLSSVARLEELPRSAIEHAAGREVVQYRGSIMPLIRLSDYLDVGRGECETDEDESQTIQVVVYSNGNSTVGLVVDRIIDIVEESVVVQRLERSSCVCGTAVIHDRVTDLLDVPELIAAAGVDLFAQHSDLQARI